MIDENLAVGLDFMPREFRQNATKNVGADSLTNQHLLDDILWVGRGIQRRSYQDPKLELPLPSKAEDEKKSKIRLKGVVKKIAAEEKEKKDVNTLFSSFRTENDLPRINSHVINVYNMAQAKRCVNVVDSLNDDHLNLARDGGEFLAEKRIKLIETKFEREMGALTFFDEWPEDSVRFVLRAVREFQIPIGTLLSIVSFGVYVLKLNAYNTNEYFLKLRHLNSRHLDGFLESMLSPNPAKEFMFWFGDKNNSVIMTKLTERGFSINKEDRRKAVFSLFNSVESRRDLLQKFNLSFTYVVSSRTNTQ